MNISLFRQALNTWYSATLSYQPNIVRAKVRIFFLQI